MRSRVPAIVLLAGLASVARAVPVPHGHLSLVSTDGWIGLLFELDPGWHIYWQNPGDSGVQPEVRWSAPKGVQIGELAWPAPSRLKDHGLVDFGYEGAVLLMAPVTVPAKGSTPLNVSADVHWAVCSETCVTAKANVATALPVEDKKQMDKNAELFAKTRRSLPQPLPSRCAVQAIDSNASFDLRFACFGSDRTLTFFPLHANQIEDAAPQRMEHRAGVTHLLLVKSDQLLTAPAALDGVLETGEGSAAYQISAPVKRIGANAN